MFKRKGESRRNCNEAQTIIIVNVKNLNLYTGTIKLGDWLITQ